MLMPSNRAAGEAPAANSWHSGHVLSVHSQGCEIDVGGECFPAAVASHLAVLAPGQRVLAWRDAEAGWLVTAAWPQPGQPAPLRYDADTACLHIEATRLQLAGVAGVELRCQDARVQLGMDGKVQVEGRDILSSALGSHRIEGASIDLN